MAGLLRSRLRSTNEQGFTLIELMVVVLIIAILMAIAIPTFLGSRNTANARAAQASLLHADITERTYFASNQTYQNSVSALHAAEPALTFVQWTTSAWTPSNTVYVQTDSGVNALLGALGADSKCYFIWDANGVNGYQIQPAASGTCSTFPSSNGGWYVSWQAATSSSTTALTSATWPTTWRTAS